MGINYNPSIVIDGLILCVDAANSRSYAGTGITWTDISGNNKSGTGVSTTYSSLNSGKFIFGTDAYFSMPLVTSTITNVTMCCWVNITTKSLKGPFMVNGSFTGYAIGVGSGSYDTAGNELIALFPGNRWIGTSVSLGLGWKHVAITLDSSSLPRIYLNGQLVNSYAGINPRVPTTATYLGREVGGESSGVTRAFNGEVGMAQMYNRQLSDAEILQNYNAGRKKYNPEQNTVNSNLTLSLDAGNINSYSGTGSSWIDLSGSSANGNLTNGPTFTGTNGGEISFDGSNDVVVVGSLGTFYSQGTISFWMNSSDVSANIRNPFSTNYDGFNTNVLRFETGETSGLLKVWIGSGGLAGLGFSTISSNTWYNVTVIWNQSTNTFSGYLNGSLNVTNSSWTLWPTSFVNVGIGSGYNRFFQGKISQVSIYNRALSAQEILQNYNALRGRFNL